MNNSLLSRGPSRPTFLLSPKILISIFFSIGLHISIANAEDLYKQIREMQVLNLRDLNIGINLSEGEFKKLEEQLKSLSESGIATFKLPNGNILELKSVGPKMGSGIFEFKLNGENIKMPNCTINFNFSIGKAANDNYVEQSKLNCKFKF